MRARSWDAVRWRRRRHRAGRCGCRAAGDAIEQRRLCDQHRRAGVFEHEGEALRGVGGVERQIGAAGLEDAEQADDHLERALDAQPDHHFGADAAARR